MPRAKSLKDQVTELSFTGDAKAIQQKLDELGELSKTLSTALKLRFPLVTKASTGSTGTPRVRARNLGSSSRKRQPQGTGAQGAGATAATQTGTGESKSDGEQT